MTAPMPDAEPYVIGDYWVTGNDDFWGVISRLDPMFRPPVTRAEEDDVFGDGQRYAVPVGVVGGQRKRPRDEDVERNREMLREFVNGYADHLVLLARMHATAQEMLAREPYSE